MAGPLAHLRIIDLSRVVAGPLATQIFSDYGAEVIKIEQPRVGDDSRHWAPPRAADGQASYFFAVNRGKQSITVDLKHPRGRALVTARAPARLAENSAGHDGPPGSAPMVRAQPAADLLLDLWVRCHEPLPGAGQRDAIMQGFWSMSITGGHSAGEGRGA
jgi:hypothetical protein